MIDIDPSPYRILSDPGDIAPLRDCMGNAIPNQYMVTTPIIALGLRRRPRAVVWGVTLVVVEALYGTRSLFERWVVAVV